MSFSLEEVLTDGRAETWVPIGEQKSDNPLLLLPPTPLYDVMGWAGRGWVDKRFCRGLNEICLLGGRHTD